MLSQLASRSQRGGSLEAGITVTGTPSERFMSRGWVELGRVPRLSCRKQTAHAPLEPEEKRGPEGMRCLLTPLSQDDALGFLPFLMQDIRQCMMGKMILKQILTLVL